LSALTDGTMTARSPERKPGTFRFQDSLSGPYTTPAAQDRDDLMACAIGHGGQVGLRVKVSKTERPMPGKTGSTGRVLTLYDRRYSCEVWYTDGHMTTREKLAEAVLAAAGLPEEAQELIAEEVFARVSDLSQSQLTVAQRGEIKRRLAQPRVHVPDAEVRALFQHYNSAL
jgi:hypothetical protein